MKTTLFSIAFFLICFSSFSQSAFNISGKIVDSTSSLPFTSVFLLIPSDSSLVTFTKADDKGIFNFKNVKKQDYLVKATFLSYLPVQVLVKFDPENLNVDIGIIQLQPIQKELFEVVVKTAKAPMSMRGDTIEYDASKFKVPPGSTVEDLLRRLPGMQLDAEGNIKAQGETVKRVTVDGKRFFGDDPKLATKNLPAEAINKVQVFNDKSEQSKATGIDDGKHEKTVNLELKDAFKKGGFGKGTVGAGTDDRVMAKANYNKFDSKNQFAALGFANNINQSGLSNNDYQDFKGSQSYNWNDNADFGFSQGGGMRFFYDDNDEEGLEIPRSWSAGQGFSKNYAGGLNYNYDTKKTKVSSNYFFNQTSLDIGQLRTSEYFLPNTSYLLGENSNNNTFSRNHRMSFRLEKELDSLNTIVVNLNSKIGERSQSSMSNLNYKNKLNEKFRDQASSNVFDASNFIFAGTMIYRHKFIKKGRNFAFSGTFNNNSNDQENNQSSTVNEFKVNGESFALNGRNVNINQQVLALSKNQEVKSSLLYIEPLGKKFYFETFYNFGNLNQEVDRDVFNKADQNKRVDSLSRFFDNTILNNRLGAGIRYSHKGINLALGFAGQQINIDGQFFNNQGGTTIGKISNTYSAVLPNLSINFDLKNNKYLYGEYNMGLKAPNIKDLQPFIDNTNPLLIKIGNPDLLPTTISGGNVGFGMYNPVTFINLWSGINYSYNKNQVIYNQTVDNSLITTLRPENISGGYRYGYNLNFGFPIKKTKVTANLGSSSGIGKNLLYINNVLNENNSENYNFSFRLDLTPKDWFSLFLSANTGLNKSKYSINTLQNQTFTNNSTSANFVLQMPKDIYFTADFRHTGYRNKKLDFNQQIPILNLSAYKILGKAKKSEIRISLYDAFKRNLGVSQSAFQNVISQSVTQTLSRYLMLSYTYNMKGVSGKVKKNRWDN